MNYKMSDVEIKAVLNALSQSIIREYKNGDVSFYLWDYIHAYKYLHGIVESMYPGWIITNDEVKKIIHKWKE